VRITEKAVKDKKSRLELVRGDRSRKVFSFYEIAGLLVFSSLIFFPYLYLVIKYDFPFTMSGDEDNWINIFIHGCGFCEVKNEKCFTLPLFLLLCRAVYEIFHSFSYVNVFLKIFGAIFIPILLFAIIKKFIEESHFAFLTLSIIVLNVYPLLKFVQGDMNFPHSPFFGFILHRAFNPNPLILFFILFVYFIIRIDDKRNLNFKEKIICGIIFGLNFYGQFYYYVHALLFIFLLLIFSKGKRKELIEISLIAFFVALPAVIFNFLQTQNPNSEAMLMRAILFTKFGVERFEFAQEKRNYVIVVLGVISALYLLQKGWKGKVLFFILISGLILGYQNAITKITIQERHFYYAFYIFSIIAIFSAIYDVVSRTKLKNVLDYVSPAANLTISFVVPALFCGIFVSSEKIFIESVETLKHVREQIILKSEYDEISDFIKTKVKENEVISLPKNLSAVIFRETLISQLNTKTYIFIYMGDREIFERSILDMKLQGFNLEEVKSIISEHTEFLSEKPPIYEIRALMGDLGIPSENLENKSEIQRKFLEEFEKLDGNKLKELINKFEVKYVIREREKTESEFFLKEIYRTKKFYIYEVRIDI
jgi:hypothetical protein